MAGRCGRRGLDTIGHVIYWGLDNFKNININNIKPLKLLNSKDITILIDPLYVFYKCYILCD